MKDIYALPSKTLKTARKLILEGKTRREIAEAILQAMERGAKKNPKLVERCGYLQGSLGEALSTLEVRLRLCDPSCEEYADYRATVQKIYGQERGVMLKKKRREDPVWREEQNRKAREHVQKKKAESPEFREYTRKRNYENYYQRVEDPVWRENRNIRMQEYGQRPEVKARTKQQAQARLAKKNARRAVDAAYDEECRRQQAERNKQWLRRMRENEPAKYAAWKESRNRKARERYAAKKAKEATDGN